MGITSICVMVEIVVVEPVEAVTVMVVVLEINGVSQSE